MDIRLTNEEKRIRRFLIKRAKGLANYTYSQLCEELILPYDMSDQNERKLLGNLLGNISEYEVSMGRPMLSSIVVDKNLRMPGKGFFTLAENLGLLNRTNSKQNFAINENKATKMYWMSHDDVDDLE